MNKLFKSIKNIWGTSKKNMKTIHSFLGFKPQKKGLAYRIDLDSIRFYQDFYVSCLCTDKEWLITKNRINGATLFEALKVEKWKEGFLWLITSEDNINIDDDYLLQKSITFINNAKLDFQTECTKNSEIYFRYESDVNSYSIIWRENKHYMNYMYYEQD